jgi:hypothetical protein
VYSKSVINLSAAAGTDGSGGMIFEREVGRVVLYMWAWDDDSVPRQNADGQMLVSSAVIRRSNRDDIASWEPVNQRGWVYQKEF